MNTTTREGLLAEEQKYLLANIDALRTRYPDRYLVIKGSKVHGNFASYDEAVDFGIERFGKGPFLVRSVSEPHGAVLSIPSLMAGIPLTVVAGGCWAAPTSSRGAGSPKTIHSEEGR